ncbi:MAG: 30S ribosomal protein S8 [Candidatus Marinimicrobia bacterium]|nr:30S ribosomal protein S8 [Candidatus Neomarinimicrobiota bacterium]
MAMTDPIADMLTRIRNAGMAEHPFVDIPSSKVKQEISKILKKEGYIRDIILVKKEDNKKDLRLYLKYDRHGKPVIEGIQRTSKPGRRVYVDVKNLPRVLNGLGIAIISTSSGIMTNYDAKEKNTGGEIICTVW